VDGFPLNDCIFSKNFSSSIKGFYSTFRLSFSIVYSVCSVFVFYCSWFY